MTDENAVCSGYEKMPVSRLEPGEMGVVLARAGAGKTACLTHLALGYLLDKEPVLHVCVDVVPDKVKLWYHKLLKDIFSNQPERKVTDLQHAIEPLRFIMSFLNRTFSPEKLETSIDNLEAAGKVRTCAYRSGRSGLWPCARTFRKDRRCGPKTLGSGLGLRQVSSAYT